MPRTAWLTGVTDDGEIAHARVPGATAADFSDTESGRQGRTEQIRGPLRPAARKSNSNEGGSADPAETRGAPAQLIQHGKGALPGFRPDIFQYVVLDVLPALTDCF